MKRSLFLFLTIIMALSASAQRIIGELEANTDMLMTPGDSALNKGKDSEGKPIVPVDVKAWTIDQTFGNRTTTFVDTLQHQFQNANLSEGINGHFSHLGNLGSPRINRIFLERQDDDEFIFLRTFDQFYVPTDQFRFYNTKSPYLNAVYNTCGSKTTGDEHIKVIYTQNAGKRINIGGLFDYMYGQGYYNSQSTSYMGANAWASYIGDKYDFHFYYTHNYMKLAENGGITDENYILHPENMRRTYDSDDIPVWLSSTWSKQEHDVIHFNHRYNIGYYRTEGDSTNLKEVFVPVSSIFHTFSLRYLRRGYIAYNTPDNYHTYDFIPGDSTNDRTKNFIMRNTVGLSLREGFNKYAAAGINAYIAFENMSFEQPDSLSSSLTPGKVSRLINNKVSENNIAVGGQLIRTQGTMIHYDVNGEFTIVGERLGDFKITGRGELNLPIMGDTAQVVLNALVQNKKPSYYLRHYHSRHAWWNNDFDKEWCMRIQGQVSYPKTRTKLTIGMENIKNYCYFENTGTATAEGFSNNVTPRQSSGNVQVISANLNQNFKFGILHIDNDITYQKSTKSDLIPLPTLSLYSNLYIEFKIAKVLNCELGGDLKYFTEYEAPDYSPVVSQFMLQNANNKKKVGNYPLISVYANFDLKRTRFYVQYYHVNQSDGRYLWLPGYPMNPGGLHFGISWNFYD
ncbi:MAG: putative porin [Bacteroidaceae bacterium]|nr:putative porin [Bacteroidaceae bacterium]